MGNAVLKEKEAHNGVYIPPNIVVGKPLHFAIDNTDFRNDTPDGKSEFHGTGQVVLQKVDKSKNTKTLEIERSYKSSMRISSEDIVTTKRLITNPVPPNESFPTFTGIIKCDELELFSKKDKVWALCQVMDDEIDETLPTWSAYNSLVTEEQMITTCQGLPLYPSSPTDWSTLYSALKMVQDINVEVTGERRTIVSLDLQLYSKCMKLRSDKEIKENFIFRLGELHIVFAMLKVIGKYIEGSGVVDKVFTEAGIYGETTLKQILDGKHMKRAVEAHITMYLALSSIYFHEWYSEHPEYAHHLSEVKKELSYLSSLSNDKTEDIKMSSDQLFQVFEESKLLETLESYGDALNYQGQFLKNYMNMCECLLLFIRSSRQGLWSLHLSLLNSLVKYFFAHDQINYARLTPLYIADMLQLKDTDRKTWNYLEQNFSVGKSTIPFTSIGSDHAMEQDNKKMKVAGGIIGLTQNKNALNRFCLTAPVMNSILQ